MFFEHTYCVLPHTHTEVVCVNVLQPLSQPPTGVLDQAVTLELMEFLLIYLTTQVSRTVWLLPVDLAKAVKLKMSIAVVKNSMEESPTMYC